DFNRALPWETWSRLRRFLGHLYQRIGIPAGFVDLVFFFGNYRNTPRGLHLDSADVFCFVVHCRKRIRIWGPAVLPNWRAQPYINRAEYARDLSRSICLEGEAGDLLYWPSRFFHVGESISALSGSVSVAMHYCASLVEPMLVRHKEAAALACEYTS